MDEIWKDIPGFEGWYQVSNLGRVKRVKKVHWNHGKKNLITREHVLTPTWDKKGYEVVIIRNESKKRHIKVHRLVAEAFIPNIENKPQVDHIDRNKRNNEVGNLRWCTNSENQLNTNRNVFLTYQNKKMTLKEWSEITGINDLTIRARLIRGWKIEDALTIKPLNSGEKMYLGGKYNGRDSKSREHK